MKKSIVGIIIGGVILAACAAPIEETEAKGEGIWEVVGTQEIGQEDFIEVRHIKTGCHATFVNDADGVDYEPMFTTSMGSVQIPYCTKK